MYRKPVWECPDMCRAEYELKRFGVDVKVELDNPQEIKVHRLAIWTNSSALMGPAVERRLE